MSTCKTCGATDWEVLPQIGAIEIMRCRKCGAEELVHTSYPMNLQTNTNEPWFSLSVDLNRSLKAEQIEMLRNIFRKLELMPPLAVKKAVIAEQTVELGNYPQSEAVQHTSQSEAIGVPIKQKLVEKPF